MNAFFEQKKDTAFDRRQMSTLRGGNNGDSGGPLADPAPDEQDDGGG